MKNDMVYKIWTVELLFCQLQCGLPKFSLYSSTSNNRYSQ